MVESLRAAVGDIFTCLLTDKQFIAIEVESAYTGDGKSFVNLIGVRTNRIGSQKWVLASSDGDEDWYPRFRFSFLRKATKAELLFFKHWHDQN